MSGGGGNVIGIRAGIYFSGCMGWPDGVCVPGESQYYHNVALVERVGRG